jgi:activator of HSP90 ATPase
VTHINKSTTNSETTATTTTATAKKVNTVSMNDDIEFQTSANELYETLLDPQRVSAWSRGPAKISREIGSSFELFNGNVSGKMLELVSKKKGGLNEDMNDEYIFFFV